jgi:hypothetical protein
VIEVEHRLVEPCHHGAEAEWSHAPRRLPPIAQRKMLLSLVRPLPEASSSLTPRWREPDSNIGPAKGPSAYSNGYRGPE